MSLEQAHYFTLQGGVAGCHFRHKLLALDEALKDLARIDARKSQIVELRFFGGLSVEETAVVMRIAPVTVMREWNKAKAWLYRELSRA